MDVVALVARQPALLLTDSWTLDFEDVQEQEQQPSSQQRQQQQQGLQQDQQGLQVQQVQQQQLPYSSRLSNDASGGFDDNGDTEAKAWSSSSSQVGQGEDVSSSGRCNSSRGSSESNSLEQMVAAWEFGLSNDGSAEWEER